MSQVEHLRRVVEDLIEVMHLQVKELETLLVDIEQSIGHLSFEPQFSVVASQLAELHHRVQHLAGPRRPASPKAHKG